MFFHLTLSINRNRIQPHLPQLLVVAVVAAVTLAAMDAEKVQVTDWWYLAQQVIIRMHKELSGVE